MTLRPFHPSDDHAVAEIWNAAGPNDLGRRSKVAFMPGHARGGKR